jgi:N-acetylmuramoyl-L-alanine amidase
MTREDLDQIIDGRTDREVVAATIWAESRDQGSIGMAAVASVIGNRLASGVKRYGVTWRGVCLRNRQFSCWNVYADGSRDPNLARILRGPTGPEWHQALLLADLAMNDLLKDPTGGATHYHTEAVSPSWKDSPKMRLLKQIGDHVFYFEVA